MATKALSRQAQYQKRKITAGLCGKCGREPLFSSTLCLGCIRVNRHLQRKARGFKPWKPGGVGRPPMGRKEGK
jgi:hypothetical protein